MTMAREAVIVGAGDVPLEDGKVVGGGSVLQVQARAAKAALDDARLSMGDVDGLLVAGLWGVPGPGILPSVTLGEYLGIIPRFADTTNIGGSAFEAHVAHAAMAIEKGYCDVALIVYGSTQRSERSRTLGGRPSVLTMQFENVWGIPQPVGGYAMAARRHMHEFGTTEEQLAEIAVATRAWASLNPAATMRDLITIDDVMTSTPIADPLKRLDCCLVTDGAGAIVMTTAENARAHGAKAIHLRGYGEAHTHWSIGAMPDLPRLTAAEIASRNAFEMAGISHDAVDIVECYDSFTITVLMTLEALGFCKPGEGGAFVAGQRTAPGGAFPLNTNGGGLSYCHPGMYGMFLLIEAVRQLRGEAGDRQVSGVNTALVHGTGGTLSSGATVILANN
ncbi:MAG: thiolase [Rhizobiaceae bacterium MnEN-MB40S]|nr:MAG: thiolase [Rhizobiaceae bacterium MnEN-MB40S]